MSFYGLNPPDAVRILDLHGVHLPEEQREVKNAISCVLLYLELLRSGKFCKACQGKGERTVQKPYPSENGYSPLLTHPCRETCYVCNGNCRESRPEKRV